MKVAVLVSGSGTNLQALLDAEAAGRLAPAEIAVVVSNNPGALALERAARAGRPGLVVDHRGRASREDFDQALLDALAPYRVEVIVLAGFMRLLTPRFLGAFPGRVVNTHPSILPAFPGHDAAAQAIAHGVKLSGCTVHLVDAGVDTGPIIAQRAVPVLAGDDAAALQARIQDEEHRLLPVVVRALAAGRVSCEGRRVVIAPVGGEGPPAMPTNSYDLIVIGDDLAGLAAAALCARRGMRTLVLGHHDRPWRYQLGPHKLPVEHTSIAGRSGGAIERVVKDLGLEHALRRRQREVRTSAQLVAPGVRLDFPADADVLGRALTRELGDDGAAVLAAWERAGDVARLADPLLGAEHAFPAAGFWERREVSRLAVRAETEAAAWWAGAEESLASSPTMAHALALTALPSALGARAWPPAPLAIARALDGWRGGVPALRGDIDTLRELLIEKLTASTGELRAGRVAELVMSWGKITAVRLENGEELGAGQVIAALPLAELVPLLGAKPPKRALELAAPLAVAGWRYTLNLVIDDGGVPEGMAPTVLAVRDPDEAPSGSNAFALHVGEADDGGRVVVTVSAVLPAPDDGVTADAAWMARALAALRKGLLESIDDVMPFIASHVMIAHSPHEATPPVVSGKGAVEVPKTLPVPPRPLWRAPTVEASAGLSAVPYAVGVKNLTIGSTQILPHLGLEGDLAAGWSAAKIAHAIAGKKKDYLRDEVLSPT